MRTRRRPADKGQNGGRVDRLREVYGVASDVALADAMRRGKTTISSWRKRGVPDAICVDVAEERGVSLHWLLHGAEAREEGGAYNKEQGGGRLAQDELALLEMYRLLSGDQKTAIKATLDAFAKSRRRKKETG